MIIIEERIFDDRSVQDLFICLIVRKYQSLLALVAQILVDTYLKSHITRVIKAKEVACFIARMSLNIGIQNMLELVFAVLAFSFNEKLIKVKGLISTFDHHNALAQALFGILWRVIFLDFFT